MVALQARIFNGQEPRKTSRAPRASHNDDKDAPTYLRSIIIVFICLTNISQVLPCSKHCSGVRNSTVGKKMKIKPDKIPFFMELMFQWGWGIK